MKRLLALALAACACTSPMSPLAVAVRKGDVRAIAQLIDKGASPDEPSGVNGWTPLMHGVFRGVPQSVETLLDKGADPNRACCQGLTPLIMAAGLGNEFLVDMLLKRGADPRQRDARGKTALDVAVTGLSDYINLNEGKCPTAIVRRLTAAAPGLKLAETGGRVKKVLTGCPETAALLTP
jgi:ankyrin repeat protein